MFEVFYINKPKDDSIPEISVFEEIEKEIKSLETKVGRYLKGVLFEIELRNEKGILIKKYQSGNYADLKTKFFKVFYYRNPVNIEKIETKKAVPMISGVIKFKRCKYSLQREFVPYSEKTMVERWVRKVLEKDQIIRTGDDNDEE